MGFFTSSSFATPEYSKGIDYSTSSLGDKEFVVSGMVDTIIENVQVTMLIMDSNGKIIFIAQTIPDENRHFAFNVTKKGSLWQNVTDYSIIVNYQKPDANSEFYGRDIGSSDGVFQDIIEIPTVLLSPLKQLNSGVPISKIQCKENYVVLLKPNRGFGGCFGPDSAMKLYMRGWPSPNDSVGVFQDQAVLIDHYKDTPEVKAFYAKYGDAKVSAQDNYMSYSAGNKTDFRIRMNLYFDEAFDITNIDLYCYVGSGPQYEIPSEHVLYFLKHYTCSSYRNGDPLTN